MKVVFSILFSLSMSLACSVFSQEIIKVKPIVDERTELLSIVFRLAGAKEYVNNSIENYTHEIDSFFVDYNNHKVVKFARNLRRKRGIGYDAVMSMAVNLKLENDKLLLKENIADSSLDYRWKEKDIIKFVDLLNDFYSVTDFHKFFSDHAEFYSKAEENFSEILDTIDFSWFEKFYGTKPKGCFNLIVSLTNGSSNYGPKVIYRNNEEDLYAIIGSGKTDSLGIPVYTARIIPVIIHEFNHSFCNQLVFTNYNILEKSGEIFYSAVKEKMKKQAYGQAKTMLCEILVRASVIKYFQDHEPKNDEIAILTKRETSRGFIWIEELVVLLDDYVQNREKYPTLSEFVPEIAKLQDSLTPDGLLVRIKERSPYIVSANIQNDDEKVDPNLKELIITFSSEMNTAANGCTYGKRGENLMPEIKGAKWNLETKKEWIIAIGLKPNTDYSISFPAEWFSDVEYNSLKEDFHLDFKTRAK